MRIRNLIILLLFPLCASAQIGEHRNVFSIGVNGGYVLSDVGFDPTVPQTYHGGFNGGLAFR